MQLKNVSARAYGLMGKIYAPLETFELTDKMAIASIQIAIDAGDMVVIEGDIKVVPENVSIAHNDVNINEDKSPSDFHSVELKDQDYADAPAKRGRPAKTKEAK